MIQQFLVDVIGKDLCFLLLYGCFAASLITPMALLFVSEYKKL
jgi:hypothetical protein